MRVLVAEYVCQLCRGIASAGSGHPHGDHLCSPSCKLLLSYAGAQILANLCRLSNESLDAGLRLMAKQILLAFVFTGRYIDDLLAVHRPYLKSLLYTTDHYVYPEIHGLLPPSLSVTCTSAGTSSAAYMDVSITPPPNKPASHRFTSMLYGKCTQKPLLDLIIIKFPHISSNISAASKYGIIPSQFHRFCRIILWRDSFVRSSANPIRELSNKGYNQDIMIQQLSRLCFRYPGPYNTPSRKLVTDITDCLASIHAK